MSFKQAFNRVEGESIVNSKEWVSKNSESFKKCEKQNKIWWLTNNMKCLGVKGGQGLHEKMLVREKSSSREAM